MFLDTSISDVWLTYSISLYVFAAYYYMCVLIITSPHTTIYGSLTYSISLLAFAACPHITVHASSY